MTRSIVLAVLLFSIGAVAGEEGVVVEHDRFTGGRTIKARIHLPRDRMNTFDTPVMHVVVFSDERALVSIAAANDNWRYLRCHNVDFLIDGQRLHVASTKQEGRVRDGARSGVIEQVVFALSADAIVAMARAKKVEGRVCRDEFALGPDKLRHLKDLADKAGWPKPKPVDPDVIIVDQP